MMLFALILGVVLVVMGYDDLDLNQEEQVLIPTATGERVTCEREIIPEDWTDPINGEYYYELVVLCNINQRIVDLLLEKKHEQYLDLPLILNYPEGEVAVNGRECIEWLGFTAEGKGPLTPTTFRCMMVVYELKGWNRKKREKEYRHHLYTSDLARLGLMK